MTKGIDALKVIVFVRQVLDTRLPLEIIPDGRVAQKGCDPTFILNPADRAALEEALRIRAALPNSRITAITLGPERARSILSDCMAAGVNGALHILTADSAAIDSFRVAQALGAAVGRLPFDLILCGDNTLDDGPSEVGPALAELLDIPQATAVVKFAVSSEHGKVIAERKLERGYRQVVEVDLPALVAVDSAICQPRYLTIRARRYAARVIDEHCLTVPFESVSAPDGASPLRNVLRRSPPRPRTKRTAPVDSALSAEDRIAQTLGWTITTKASKGITGDPDSIADEIVAFLSEKGII